MNITEYIDSNYPDLVDELDAYVNSDEFTDDVDRIMDTDGSITEDFAKECAVDQKVETLQEDETDMPA